MLITNVEYTIASAEGRKTMSDQEKFEGFKQKLIDDNEKKYGKEIREKYGDETVQQSNAKLKNMTQAQHDEVTRLADELYETLAEAFKQGDPASELARRRPNFTSAGSPIIGTITVRRPTPALLKCMSTMSGLPPIMMRSSLERQHSFAMRF